MDELLESYQTLTDLEDDESVEIKISIKSSNTEHTPESENEAVFLFSASRRQAALYVLLSDRGEIKVLPTESFGSVKSIDSIVDLIHSIMDPDLRRRKIDIANKNLEESSHISEDEFVSNAIEKISADSYNFAVSLLGEDVKGPILVGEMLACLPFFTFFQTAEIGFYQKFVEDLDSTQILNLARKFRGDIEGYFTSKRSIDKLLFAEHGRNMSASALHSYYGSDVLGRIDKKMCVFHQSHVTLTIECESADNEGESTKVVRLQTANDKIDLKNHSIKKPNGKEYLIVQSATINNIHTIERRVKYLFPNQDRVSAAINADTLVFHAGYITVRFVSGKFQMEIPITEHLTLSGNEHEYR